MTLESTLGMITRSASGGQETKGRMPFSVVKGIVTNNIDPENKRRIKASSALMPQLDTKWSYRLNFFPQNDVPLPKIGHTVLLIYEESNPLKPFYLTIDNPANPVLNKTDPVADWFLEIPGIIDLVASELPVKIRIENDTVTVTGDLLWEGVDTLEMKAPTLIKLEAPQIEFFGNVYVKGNVLIHGNLTVIGEDENPGNYTITGDVNLNGNLSISGSSVSINGSQVATVGARDDSNDDLITKGW